jgi:hypothetical protein
MQRTSVDIWRHVKNRRLTFERRLVIAFARRLVEDLLNQVVFIAIIPVKAARHRAFNDLAYRDAFEPALLNQFAEYAVSSRANT